MTHAREEAGFTMIEVLVAITLFSILSVGFYQVMLSGVRGTDTTQDVVTISSEARLGLNRMVRETREADVISCAGGGGPCATPTSYTVNIDFNGDGVYDPSSMDVITFTYDSDDESLFITAAGQTESLVVGVGPVPGRDIFTYSSSRLEYDTNRDGVATWQEIDATTGIGNGNGELDAPEVGYITNVRFAIRVFSGDRASNFFAEAQLRNRR